MEITWVEEKDVPSPDEKPAGNNFAQAYAAFAEELKKHPGQWAKWPIRLSKSSLYSAKSGVTKGRFTAFREGKWEAQISNDTILVRYVGPEEE